jgi:iron transport multicopper oxidase
MLLSIVRSLPFFRMVTVLLLACLALCQTALSKTVTYNWDVTWVWAAPDGHGRPVIGINNQFPCPPMEVRSQILSLLFHLYSCGQATIGDRVIVNLNNKLGNETTSLHFHGIFQTGTNAMDGPSGVTQCPIPPGGTFTYDFIVRFELTFGWFSAHTYLGKPTWLILVSFP